MSANSPFIWSEAAFNTQPDHKETAHGDLLPVPMTRSDLDSHLYEVRNLLGRMKVCADKNHMAQVTTDVCSAALFIQNAIDLREAQSGENLDR